MLYAKSSDNHFWCINLRNRFTSSSSSSKVMKMYFPPQAYLYGIFIAGFRNLFRYLLQPVYQIRAIKKQFTRRSISEVTGV